MLQNLMKLLPRSTTRFYATSATAAKSKAKRKTAPKANASALITCKRSEFNLLVPGKEAKFGSIELASKGWLHNKSKGDHFTINATLSEHEQQAQMKDINEVLTTCQLALHPDLVTNLNEAFQITRFTDVQVQSIPKIVGQHHVLIAAETGCGKTMAYLLPIVQKVLERRRLEAENPSEQKERKMNTPLAVIVTPGRELASQIGSVAEKLCRNTDLNVKTVLGGNTKQLMVNPDFQDVDILVATVGALSKLTTTGIYRMQHVRYVVLDEADTLLDDSFSDKLCHFLKRFPFHKNYSQNDATVGAQLILASATMPTNIQELLQQVVDVSTIHEVVSPNLHKLLPHVQQKFLRITKADRPVQLLYIVKNELFKKRPVIVFSNKSVASDYVSIFLNKNGVNCLNLNGDMLMKIRLGRFEQFQNAECDVLSTTDIGSRGLDTTRARHVINFDFPLHVSDYIHRCGRIGRVGHMQKCFVTNLISSRREIEVVQRIEHAARTGGLLPNVNANIRNLIQKRIMQDMKKAGMEVPEEVF